MNKIYIIGAGNLGSRHLQALKKVNIPLDITVIDPSNKSLAIAQERYRATDKGLKEHKITFQRRIEGEGLIDLAIIATNADVRRKVIENILKIAKVKYFVLEKLLFTQKKDYQSVGQLFKKSRSKAWVNCSMRSMPFYYDLKKNIDSKFIYLVTGGQFGLVTNMVHYLDHMAYLSNGDDYEVDTSGLDPRPVKSKRKGFLELNGRLMVNFKNGSIGIFECYPEGSAPIQVEIYSNNFRCISRESAEKAWISQEKNNWRWKVVEAKIPFQSERTTKLVEDILKTGKCLLPDYSEACKLHLPLLESLRQFLNKNSKKQFDYYPFT